ncbi:MAG: ParB/RepB/Spo0J family partition protein [Candidatus Omnitrophica bacterium]|nr:ParB/RepB/Spo0J family partition protein [Candidatus Omnitrophota bacterium]
MEGKALGKGLSALIPEREKDVAVTSGAVAYLKTNSIQDNSLQPRTNYDNEKLNDLKASIKEKGVLQPILVREKNGQYEVVAGERRLRAARALDLDEVPVIIKDVTDQEAFVIALVENIQREELNPIEEAEAYRKLIEEFSYTQEAVAQSVGKDRSTISNLLRVLKLPVEIRRSVYNGELSVGHARALLSVEIPMQRDSLFVLTMKKGLSVRELENLVQSKSKGGTRRASSQTAKDHEVIALEEDLQRTLGTKVRLMPQKKRGKIVIEYYSLDDLDRIIQIIKK